MSNPNLTFTHLSPLDAWYERLCRHVTGLHDGKCRTKNYLHGPAGIPGLSFNYGVGEDDCFAELFIKPTTNTSSESVFDNLHTHHDAIEKAFGGSLDWDRMNGKRTCRIRYEIRSGYLAPRENWPVIQASLIATMNRLELALEPYLREIG